MPSGRKRPCHALCAHIAQPTRSSAAIPPCCQPPPRPRTTPARGRWRARTVVDMTPDEIADLVCLRKARDLIDREYARPLDVPAMARTALMSPSHFSRKCRAAYGETPYSYLMTR